jgi:hypothetical protein
MRAISAVLGELKMGDTFDNIEFVSTGEWDGPEDLYPPPAPGVQMKLERFEIKKVAPGFVPYYYKVKITKDVNPATSSRPIIEQAIYFPRGPDMLVARYNEVLPGLVMTDTIVVFRHGETNEVDHIRHYLEFWNGAAASWPCRRKF